MESFETLYGGRVESLFHGINYRIDSLLNITYFLKWNINHYKSKTISKNLDIGKKNYKTKINLKVFQNE